MDKDISRLAVEKAAETVARVRKKLKTVIPYGPRMGRPTAAEWQRALKQPTPTMIQQLIDTVGEQRALELLMRAKPNG